MNYYPHNISDFNNATRHLTRIERSVYRDLLDLYYDKEQPLPLDVPVLCRKIIAAGEAEATAVQQVLNEFFTETQQGWHHQRCEQVIADYRRGIGNKSAAGIASALKREQKRLDVLEQLNSCATTAQQPLDCADGSVELTKTRTKTKTKTITSSQADAPAFDNRGEAYPADFEEAWSAYPNRPGASKKESFRAWSARVKAGVAAERLIAGVRRYAQYVAAMQTEPQYVKQPSTFFGPGEHYLADWTPSPPRPAGAWWSSDAAILAKGSALGMTPLAGEAMAAFKGRIQAAIDNGGKPVLRAMSRIAAPAVPERSVMPAGIDLKALVKR